MSIRESFVQHFGEENAVRVEEASIGHQNDDVLNHGKDEWGTDPFRYHILSAVGHRCFGKKWAEYHGITVSEDDAKAWALLHADLHLHDGDLPDYIAFMAGVYAPWIDWEKAGIPKPAVWEGIEDNTESWDAMSTEEKTKTLKEMTKVAMDLLDMHEKGPSDE